MNMIDNDLWDYRNNENMYCPCIFSLLAGMYIDVYYDIDNIFPNFLPKPLVELRDLDLGQMEPINDEP